MTDRKFSFGLSDNCHKWGLNLDEETRERVQERFREEVIGLFRDAGINWHLDLASIGVLRGIENLYTISDEELVTLVGRWIERANRDLRSSPAWKRAKRGELAAEPIDWQDPDKPLDWTCCNFQGKIWRRCEAFVLHEKVDGKIRDFEIEVPTDPKPDPKAKNTIRIPLNLVIEWECDTSSDDGYPKP